MARGHWLDPFARSLLEATGQLPRRPKPAPAQAPANDPLDDATDQRVERDLLELKLRHNPERRLSDSSEVVHAAALGWRLDVNRASAADWLRLPGISPAQVDLLLRLQQGGVQLSGPEDLERLLELPRGQVEAWEPLLLFRWYGDGAPPQSRSLQVDLNHASAQALERQLPQLDPQRRARLLRERQRAPFNDLADLQLRLQLPPALVEDLIGKVRFGLGPAGPQLPRSA
jgi:DNA uptake protein ComE-like DNA-binding protein